MGWSWNITPPSSNIARCPRRQLCSRIVWPFRCFWPTKPFGDTRQCWECQETAKIWLPNVCWPNWRKWRPKRLGHAGSSIRPRAFACCSGCATFCAPTSYKQSTTLHNKVCSDLKPHWIVRDWVFGVIFFGSGVGLTDFFEVGVLKKIKVGLSGLTFFGVEFRGKADIFFGLGLEFWGLIMLGSGLRGYARDF